MKRHPYLAPAAVVSLMLVAATPAARAQRYAAPDTVDARDGAITLRLGDDGHVTINGKAVDDDGTLYLRVGPGDDDVRRVHFSAADGRGFALFDDDDALGVWTRDRLGQHAPLMRRYRLGDGDHEHPFAMLSGNFEPPEDTALRGMLVSPWSDDNREIDRMERESHRLAEEVRRAEGAERERTQRQLRDLLEKIFDKKLALQRDNLDRIAKEHQRQQDRYDQRKNARDQIIDRHLKEMLGEGDALQW